VFEATIEELDGKFTGQWSGRFFMFRETGAAGEVAFHEAAIADIGFPKSTKARRGGTAAGFPLPTLSRAA
jgi:hypothetical protein